MFLLVTNNKVHIINLLKNQLSKTITLATSDRIDPRVKVGGDSIKLFPSSVTTNIYTKLDHLVVVLYPFPTALLFTYVQTFHIITPYTNGVLLGALS